MSWPFIIISHLVIIILSFPHSSYEKMENCRVDWLQPYRDRVYYNVKWKRYTSFCHSFDNFLSSTLSAHEMTKNSNNGEVQICCNYVVVSKHIQVV